MTNYDITKPYIQYIEDVTSGRELAGWFVIKSCERAKSWFNRDDLELRYGEVDRKINLVQKIKHKKGLLAGQPFKLLPFQQFIFMNIFGWYYKNSDKRVISNVLLMMARQTGKTYTAAAISLAIALDPTLPSPTVDFIANSAKQSAIAFGHCKDQCSSLDPKGKIFSRYRSEIRIPLTGASINVLSADATKLDGRASYFVADEIHEMRTWAQWEIMKSGQGSLKNPLAIGVSTSGFHIGEEYPLYSMWTTSKKILSGEAQDDTWFYMIFQLDEGDKWDDPKVWKKAIPTLGVAVDEDYIKNRIQEAKNIPSKEVDVKTKNLNMFVQSSEVWFAYDFLKSKTQHIDLHDYSDEDCFMGVDFSTSDDLSAFVVLIPPNPDRELNPNKFIIKPFVYIPQKALEISSNRTLYKYWITNHYATLTEGNVIDTLQVLNHQLEISKYLNVIDCAFDQYFALDWQIHAEEEGLPITKHNQSLAAFTPSTDFFESIMAKDLVILDDNPIFLWMFSNVEMKRNETYNTKKPSKANNNVNNKIDAIIATLEAITSYNADRGQQFGGVWYIDGDQNKKINQ